LFQRLVDVGAGAQPRGSEAECKSGEQAQGERSGKHLAIELRIM